MWTTPGEEEIMALQVILWGGKLQHKNPDRAAFPVLMALRVMPDQTAKSIGEAITDVNQHVLTPN